MVPAKKCWGKCSQGFKIERGGFNERTTQTGLNVKKSSAEIYECDEIPQNP